MIQERVERLRTLITRFTTQPGGAYPVFRLAMADVDDEERKAMHAIVAASPFAEAFAVWSDPASTTGQRALALAKHEPELAHVHALLGDLRLRDDSAHDEPMPELRAIVEKKLPAYAKYLAEIKREYDCDGEMYVTRRGFSYYASEAAPLLATDEERLCFGRGGGYTPLPIAEVAESVIVHQRDGAKASLTAAQYCALECPELLVELNVQHDARDAIPALARARRLRGLALSVGELRGDIEEGRPMFGLPLERLTLALPEKPAVALPSWLAELRTLRSLHLSYAYHPYAKTPPDPAAVPASIGALTQLRELSIRNPRSIPDEIGNLTELRMLVVSGYFFLGMPRTIVKCRSLERLHMETGHGFDILGLPEGFEALTQLTDLKLTVLAGDRPPPALLRMPWIERLHILSRLKWSDTDVASLKAALPKLKQWYCYPVGK